MGILSSEAWVDELEKIAVTLGQLRTAWKAKVAPRLLRRVRGGTHNQLLRRRLRGGPNDLFMSMPAADKWRSPTGAPSYASIQGDSHKRFRSVTEAPLEQFPQRYHGMLEELRRSGAGNFFNKEAPPAAREVFNRSVGLHEAQGELGRHFGEAVRNTRTEHRAWLGSHKSTRPFFQDMNIAATLSGPGAEAAAGIRSMRSGNLAELQKTLPEVSRLHLGEQRISRHAQKRLQELYEARRPVEQQMLPRGPSRERQAPPAPGQSLMEKQRALKQRLREQELLWKEKGRQQRLEQARLWGQRPGGVHDQV